MVGFRVIEPAGALTADIGATLNVAGEMPTAVGMTVLVAGTSVDPPEQPAAASTSAESPSQSERLNIETNLRSKGAWISGYYIT